MLFEKNTKLYILIYIYIIVTASTKLLLPVQASRVMVLGSSIKSYCNMSTYTLLTTT